jgi:hypothetical protein
MIEATRGIRKHLGGDRRTQTLNGSLDYALRRELKLDGARSRRRIRQFLQAFHHASPLAPTTLTIKSFVLQQLIVAG